MTTTSVKGGPPQIIEVHIPGGPPGPPGPAGPAGATSLTDLTDVSGTPGIGKSPVGAEGGDFPLTHITTTEDLDQILATVAGVDLHHIGAPGEPPFLSSFRNIGDPWATASYRNLANSTMRLQGTVTCDDTTIADATWIPIFQVPIELAPGENLEFVTLTNDNTWSRINVWSDGTIVWAGYIAGAPHAPVTRLPLNHISWSTTGPSTTW